MEKGYLNCLWHSCGAATYCRFSFWLWLISIWNFHSVPQLVQSFSLPCLYCIGGSFVILDNPWSGQNEIDFDFYLKLCHNFDRGWDGFISEMYSTAESSQNCWPIYSSPRLSTDKKMIQYFCFLCKHCPYHYISGFETFPTVQKGYINIVWNIRVSSVHFIIKVLYQVKLFASFWVI